MKLGIHIPLEFFTSTQAIHAAQIIEGAGLDHVVVNDHLKLPKGPHINEAWTILAGMGAVTSKIRLGPCVSPLPLRHPYLLAKMATTVDQLTKGRLLMGVGAGWHGDEFDWVGAPFLPHSKRVSQTEEALQLIQRYWTEAEVSFRGDYYDIDGVALEPKPVQQPHPQLYLGGGSVRILELTVEYGAGWMPFAPTTSGLVRRLKLLNEMLTNAGRSIQALEIIPSILLQFGKSKKAAQKLLPGWGKPPTEDRAIFGSPEDCLARIQDYADVGATHLALRLVNPKFLEQDISTLEEQILPNL